MDVRARVTIAVLSVLCVGLAMGVAIQALDQGGAAPDEADAFTPPFPEPSASGQPLAEVTFPEVEAATDAKPADLVGEWLNEAEELGALTRITVTESAEGLRVQPWAADADGERPYGPAQELAWDGNPVELVWDVGFAKQRMRLAMLPDGALQVARAAACMAEAGAMAAEPVTEYFYKGTDEDLAAHSNTIADLAAVAEQACEAGAAGGVPT